MTRARRVLPDEARRGWCPSLGRPMPTGDGLLARVHPPLGVLSVDQLRAVAEGARRFGNGHVDVTARANLQIRGVHAETASALAVLLAEAGLGDVRDDGGPQRLTLTSPLAGLDPDHAVDVRALASAIEAEGLGIVGVPPKTLVAIPGVGVTGDGADVVVWPIAGDRVAVTLAGDVDVGITAAASGVAKAVAAVLRAFAVTGQRRVRDLAAAERSRLFLGMEGVKRSHCALPPCPRTRREDRDDLVVVAVSPKGEGEGAAPEEALSETAPHRRLPPRLADDEVGKAPSPRVGSEGDVSAAADLPAGLFDLGPMTILVVDSPFGRSSADALDRLADAANVLASPDIRVTPSRGFVLACRSRSAGVAALESLAAAGFIIRRDDPRRAVAACPGAPACGSGTTPVPDHAARLAEAFAPFAARGLTAHVSGCAKGCAHPDGADLTLVAEDGRYCVVLDRPPGGASAARLTFEAALERVRKADPAEPLARAFFRYD